LRRLKYIIQDFMLKLFFPSIHKKYCDIRNDKLEAEHKNIICEINKEKAEEKNENYISYFNIINKLVQNYELIGIEKNKEEYMIVEKLQWKGEKNHFHILLDSPRYSYKKPRIITNRYYIDDIIKIEDIITVVQNVGNGSLAMKHFIETSRRNGIKKIIGNINSVDKDHFDRLEHFYRKHNFIVTFNGTRTCGRIEKIL
jgi:hypothetical protein